MAVHVEADPATGQTVLVFALAADIHDGPVSVVGSFNHWTPGEHVLQEHPDGTRSARVTIDPDTDADIHFRYLGSGGVWFDDPDSDTIEFGSITGGPAQSTSIDPVTTPVKPPSTPPSPRAG
ncbi:MAG: isoamylase [Actinomycetota bacterium]|nr:isoamylase [Actinomycetota bacterium]